MMKTTVGVTIDGVLLALCLVWLLVNALDTMRGAPASAAPADFDPGFGNEGVVRTDFGGGFDSGMAVAIQGDGKIVAAGYAIIGEPGKFALARYDETGMLDDTFDGDGLAVTPIVPGEYSSIDALALQPDGKIVAAGHTSGKTGNNDFVVARYGSDGSLDTAFGAGGIVITNVDILDHAYAAAIQADGKVVITGTAWAEFTVLRYNDDGTLDGTFGSAGVVTTDLGGGFTEARALAIQPDGKIIVGGFRNVAGVPQSADFALVRYDTNGILDGTFGIGGIVISDFGGSDGALALVLQPDGRIVAGGTVDAESGDNAFALARYDANGMLDTSFGVGGLTTTDLVSGQDWISSLALQGDGKIVAAGLAQRKGNDHDFALARYEADGSLDLTFGNEGAVVVSSLLQTQGAHAISLDGAGRIVVLGSDDLGDFTLLRLKGGEPLACLPAPQMGCRVSTQPRRSLLKIKNGSPDRRDKVAFKWVRGDATFVPDYGDPQSADDYALCVYSEAALPSLVHQERAPAGGACTRSGRECWKASGVSGYRYRDLFSTPDGVRSLRLKADASGAGAISVIGNGDHLTLSSLPLSLPARVQVQAGNGECWGAVFSTAGVRKNTGGEFNGRSD